MEEDEPDNTNDKVKYAVIETMCN